MAARAKTWAMEQRWRLRAQLAGASSRPTESGFRKSRTGHAFGRAVGCDHLHLYLNAQFDHALRRKPEERGRPNGVPRHQHEQLFAPDRHPLLTCDDDRLATEEVGGV